MSKLTQSLVQAWRAFSGTFGRGWPRHDERLARVDGELPRRLDDLDRPVVIRDSSYLFDVLEHDRDGRR